MNVFDSMKQSHPELPVPETLTELKLLIKERIGKLNVEDVKFDVAPFIKYTSTLDIWSKEYFCAVADQVV